MNPFQSLRSYEVYIYTLTERHATIARSTLTIARRSRIRAELRGELSFHTGHRLVVYEGLTWDEGSVIIDGYSCQRPHR